MMSAPTTEYDWYNLGNGLSSSAGYKDAAKHYQEAKAAYTRALQMSPNLAAAWNNLGVLEQRMGDGQAALTAYQRAAALGNTYAASNYKILYQALTAPPSQAGGARGNGGLAALNASRRMQAGSMGVAKRRQSQLWREPLRAMTIRLAFVVAALVATLLPPAPPVLAAPNGWQYGPNAPPQV